MILLQNSILKLDYNPATDILEIDYPDLHGFLVLEIKHNINALVDIVKNYDIKKVLLDSTKTVISVSEEESKQVATYLAAGLVQTRVQQVARVQSHSTNVETTAQGNIRHIQASLSLPFQLKNFTSKADAIAWLMGCS
jgi:hypothetical protein